MKKRVLEQKLKK